MVNLLKKYKFSSVATWRDLFVLLGGLVVFVVIAVSTVDKFSIWFDEAFGSYMIRFNFFKVALYTAHDVHPPLYYWLLKIWASLFGNTELGLRSMSIFFGAITVVFTFLLVLKLWGRRAAYLTLLLLILSPVFIRYSQEARMYTMLAAIVVAATYVMVYALQTSKRWLWILYGVLIAAGMWTQYLVALAWLAHWAWRYWTIRTPGESFKQTYRKFFSKEWKLAYGLSILLFLPWLPFMAAQIFVIQGFGFWIGPVSSTTLPDLLTDTLMFTNSSGVWSWLALGFYLVVGIFTYISYRLVRDLKGLDRQKYMLVLALVIVPTVLLFLASLPPLRSAFIDRYLLPSIVFLSVLFAINITSPHSGVSKVVRIVGGLTLVGLLVVGIANQMVIGNYNESSNTANMTRQLVEGARASSPNIPIVGSTPWIFYEAVLYDKPASPVYFIDETTQYSQFGSLLMLRDDNTFKIKNLDAFTHIHPNFWYIGDYTNGNDLTALRGSWKQERTVKINNYLTGQPVLEAVLFHAQ